MKKILPLVTTILLLSFLTPRVSADYTTPWLVTHGGVTYTKQTYHGSGKCALSLFQKVHYRRIYVRDNGSTFYQYKTEDKFVKQVNWQRCR